MTSLRLLSGKLRDLDGFSGLRCAVGCFVLSRRVPHLLGRQSFCIHDLYYITYSSLSTAKSGR